MTNSQYSQKVGTLIFKLNIQLKMDHQQNTNGDSIQVVVRVKPGCEDEAVLYTHNEIKLDKHSFGFDRVFGPNSQQEDLFTAVGKKLLTHTFEGYNSCIFVYGQTGSGKTYTMMGNSSGMMQRSFCELFARIDRMTDSQCIVTCSYFQLYNEQIIDLLDRGKERKSLNIRQDVKKGVFVENLTEESALNSEKLLDCLMTGMKNRHIGQTQMNRQSSRSHSIFTISLVIKSEIDGKKVMKTPKLHFVDLAGSERQKMTMATGDRLKEAGNINKSLTTLGMVINALASDKAKVHIPYRDSKLTCLLRDSLGGNSKTFIVATISTSNLCFQQTLSTLNFANRAKMVKVKALVNEQSLSTNLQQYKDEIRRLRQQIQKLKSQKRVNFQPVPSETVISKNSNDLEHKFELITTKIEDLKSNMMNNSSMDSFFQKLQRNQGDQMIDQGLKTPCEIVQEQGNELIEYMVSNHDLLKKIHTTISEYRDLKQEIKNVEINRRLPMQEIRTPSKFERDQYEDLIVKRQNHIKELEERIVLLKELNFKREVEIKENRKKLVMSEYTSKQEGEEMQRLRLDQEEHEKRLGELQLKCQMIEDERRALKASVSQLQNRLKQSKQLYVYSEQKYENQKFLRAKLETTIKQLNKKSQQIQTQKKELIQELNSKIQELEERLLEGEQREEELKSEQDILNETLQFNKRKMRQYADKLQEANRQMNQYVLANSKLTESVVSLEFDAERKRIQYQSTVDQLTISLNDIKYSNIFLEDSINRVRLQKNVLGEDLSSMKEKLKSEIQILIQQVNVLQQEKLSLSYELQQLKVTNNRLVYDYEIRVFGLEKTINNLTTDLETLKNWKAMMEEKYQTEKTLWQEEKNKLTEQVDLIRVERENMVIETQQMRKKQIELQAFVNANKNIIEDHEQLKKTYMEIIKENYRLKGQYHTTNGNEIAKNEELASKVTFYEEKFKLMSMEYYKIEDTTKKLKQKQLALMKKIEYYEQHEKLKKIHRSSEAEEVKSETMKSLQIENDELKQSLTKAKTMYERLMNQDKKEDYSKRLSIQSQTYQLEQREEKIRKRLESAIKNWDHAKENNCAGMNLDELFNCWSKIETESRKKFQGIAKAIKREQKLKSQNNYILKQNILLREQIQSLEKDITLQALGNPRKLIKPNQQIQQNKEC